MHFKISTSWLELRFNNDYNLQLTVNKPQCIITVKHGNEPIAKKIQIFCNEVTKRVGKNDKIKGINLFVNELFVLEIEKFMSGERNKLPNNFLHLLKFNHSVHTILTRNKNDFHFKFYLKILIQQSFEFSEDKA